MAILHEFRQKPPASIFGDGSDGDVVVMASLVATREMYFRDLTVDPGATVDGLWKIHCSRKLVNYGTIGISTVGGNGTSFSQGSVPPATYGHNVYTAGNGGQNGANGFNAGGGSVGLTFDATKGKGGAGGSAGAFTGGTGNAMSAVAGLWATYGNRATSGQLSTLWKGSYGYNYAGCGGGGAAAAAGDIGGGGGGRGGYVNIAARELVNFGLIDAHGGNGANGTGVDAGGGGGGGGGHINIQAEIYRNFGTLNVSGGLGGLGVGSGGNGVDGSDGYIILNAS